MTPVKVEVFTDQETEEITVYLPQGNKSVAQLFDEDCFIADDEQHAEEIADDIKAQLEAEGLAVEIVYT